MATAPVPVPVLVRGALVTCAVALVIGAAGCGPPQHVALTLAGVDVVVDGDTGAITFVRGGRTLLDVKASGVGAKKSDATFDMQFGMFDIEEGTAAPTFAQKLAITAASGNSAAFALTTANGDALATGRVRATAEGAVELEVNAQGGDDDVVVGSACPFTHAIGLGAQTHDVDQVGQRVPLWVSEQGIGTTDDDTLPSVWQLLGRRHTSYAPIPAFVADNDAAYVLDTSAFSRIDLCGTDANLTFEAWEPHVALDVYAGDTPREAQAKMVDALGRPPLPPPWMFAPWNDAIFGSDNVRAVAQRLRDAGIPSSVIWTEDWRGGSDTGGGLYRLDEDWNADPVMYPDFPAMVHDVNALGFQQLVYFNTFAVTGADIFGDVTHGLSIKDPSGAPFLFAGPDKNFSPTTMVDLTNGDARAFVKQHLQGALDDGVRGWMADFGEWLPVDGVALADGEDPHLAHNAYPLAWQKLNREALEERHVLDDSVVFVRSASLHSQPFVQAIWAGDQRTTFADDDGLPTVLPIGIGLSAVGFPFFTHDVAGYQSATNPPGTKELFQRWTELGALSPIMRTHHGTHPTLNSNLFSDDDNTAHWKRWAQIHIELYPYLRKLARDAVAPGGSPLWIPLPLAFPGDDAVWPLKDEVLLGSALLLAPVVTEGATSRSITFPSARFSRMAPIFSPALDGRAAGESADGVVVGPAVVDVTAPVHEMPVYIVAGGIVPMTAQPVDTLVGPGVRGPHARTGLDATERDRVVVVGLGADGAFTEESGATYTLTGNGTTAPASTEPDGAVVVVGNDTVTGDGFTFTTTQQPATRTTRVIFR